MNVYLANSFSINMLDKKVLEKCILSVDFVDAQWVRSYLKQLHFENIIGHKYTDNIVRKLIWGDENSPKGERKTIKINLYDEIVVAQYFGERLEEGTTSLPEKSEISFAFIKCLPNNIIN